MTHKTKLTPVVAPPKPPELIGFTLELTLRDAAVLAFLIGETGTAGPDAPLESTFVELTEELEKAGYQWTTAYERVCRYRKERQQRGRVTMRDRIADLYLQKDEEAPF